jgi:hypothetical protein
MPVSIPKFAAASVVSAPATPASAAAAKDDAMHAAAAADVKIQTQSAIDKAVSVAAAAGKESWQVLLFACLSNRHCSSIVTASCNPLLCLRPSP